MEPQPSAAKKILLSAGVIIAYGMYAAFRQLVLGANQPDVSSNIPALSVVPTITAATPRPSAAPSAPSPSPSSAPRGQYRDGQYTGAVADAYYGPLQVQAVIQGGRLTNINFLQYPNDRSRSVEINYYALPILRTEAIQAQSARVDAVTGASDSSPAFVQSLSSALAQAR
jgi:uncharacterized protein with FMN-binding domain